MDIVFLRTRWHYGSYTDYWRLVELAGFETIWLDELEPGRKAIYIVSPRNGELPDVLARLQGDHACKLVWWCLERPDAQGSVTRGQALEEGIDELWLSDRWLANLHREKGWGPVRFVPLGSHEDLGYNERLGHPRIAYEYAWTHMSYANPRRMGVYSRILARMLPNCWGPARDQGLRLTRIMLNVHQDDWPVIEPLRWALAAAYGMTLISEWVEDPYPLKSGLHLEMDVYDCLHLLVNHILERLGEDHGTNLWIQLTRNFTFGGCVREAAACIR